MKYAIITIIFIMIFVYYFTRPAAAAVELSGSLVVEASAMIYVGTGSNEAHEENGWALLGEGALIQNIIFSEQKHDFEIVAKGTFAGGGWPIMEVKIDQIVIATFTVDSGIWKSFYIEDVVGIEPGLRKLSVAFTNDFYENPNDRNLYLQKVMVAEIIGDKRLTLAWDDNTEADLDGYKIYYGSVSRKEIQDAIGAWCTENEPTNDKCVAEWEAICKREDPEIDNACHSMLYGYDTVIDVKKVNEYQVKGLEEGKKYFFAATAYDTDKNESSFSIELTHLFPYNKPGQAKDLRQKAR